MPSHPALTVFRRGLQVAAAAVFLWSLFGAYQLRHRLPAEPFYWPDSLSYSSPGMTYEATGTWTASARQFLYPLIVYVVTRISGHTSAVVSVQHWGGIVAGFLLAATWLVLLRPLWRQPIAHALCLFLGALALHVFWTSPVILLYECYVMPEAWFHSGSALEFLLLACTVRELLRPDARPRRLGPLLAATVVVTVGLYFIMPRSAVSVALIPAGLFALAWLARRHVRTTVISIGAGLLASALIFFVPERLFRRHVASNAPYFVEMLLFTIHADIIRPELDRELNQPAPAFSRKLLQDCRDAIDAEIERCRNHPASRPAWPQFPLNPDELMFGDVFIPMVLEDCGGDGFAVKNFFGHFYRAAWKHQPGAMLAKVWREFSAYNYVIPSRAFSSSNYRVDIAELGASTLKVVSDPGRASQLEQSAIWRDYPARLAATHPSGWLSHEPLALAGERALAVLFLPLAVLAVGLAGWAAVGRRRDPVVAPERMLALTSLVFFIPGLGANLTVAITHAAFHPRYLETNLVLSLVSAAAAGAAVIGAVSLLLERFSAKPVAGTPES